LPVIVIAPIGPETSQGDERVLAAIEPPKPSLMDEAPASWAGSPWLSVLVPRIQDSIFFCRNNPSPEANVALTGQSRDFDLNGMVLPTCLPKPTLHGCYRPVRTYNEAVHAGIPGVGSRVTRSPTLSVFTSSPTWAVGRLGTSRFAFAFTGEMESAS